MQAGSVVFARVSITSLPRQTIYLGAMRRVQPVARGFELRELALVCANVGMSEARLIEMLAHLIKVVDDLLVPGTVRHADIIYVILARTRDPPELGRLSGALEKTKGLAPALCTISLVQGSPPKTILRPDANVANIAVHKPRTRVPCNSMTLNLPLPKGEQRCGRFRHFTTHDKFDASFERDTCHFNKLGVIQCKLGNLFTVTGKKSVA